MLYTFANSRKTLLVSYARMPTNQIFKHNREVNKRINMEMVKYKEVESKIINIRGIHVILDSDIAALYEVETKHINQAVRNNPERFPNKFIIELTAQEKTEVVKNFDHLQKIKFSKVNPKAFTEQGLYMLSTILKSPRAVEAAYN